MIATEVELDLDVSTRSGFGADSSPGCLRAAITASLVRLGSDYVDVLQLPGIAAQVFATEVLLTLLAHWSRSLWAPIVAHSSNAFLAFVVFAL